MASLLEILGDVTSSLDLRRITNSIVSRLTEIVPAVRCSIVHVDAAMTRCFVLASHDKPDLEPLDLDMAKYPEIRRALETRESVIVQDVHTHPLMAEVRHQLEDLDFHSIAVIPITFGEEVLGSLCIKSARVGGERFTEGEIKYCTAVARASANALKNALLHREVAEQLARHRTTGEKLARILNFSPDVILTTDTQGRITEFNRGAEELLGYPRGEILGRTCAVLLGAGREEHLLRELRLAGDPIQRPRSLTRKDGATVEIDLRLSALRDQKSGIIGSVWIGRDLTELKAAQSRLVQAEKLSTIGEVVSGVAHELSNPLSGVLGYSQLLMARHGDSPLVRELEKINESALRCQKNVKNLLSFARAHKPEPKYLGINGILEKTLDIKKYQLHVNNVEIVRELDPELPCTMVDFHQMLQVFMNLINNAQHAMVAVRERPGRLVVRTAHVRGTIRVEIIDNGEGMGVETLKRIFDPFFTTKEPGEGTGLGLSVSYGIMKEHGGLISALSRKGRGTTFVVELPVSRETLLGDKNAAETTQFTVDSESPGGHILVVDDEPLIIDLLVEVLEDAGHRVDTAANGVEACRKVVASRFDLVITDVRMPQMNGIELYRHILRARPELEGRVVFVTGDLIDSSVVEFLAEVVARTLPKPLEISTITEVVHQLLLPLQDSPHAAGLAPLALSGSAEERS